jgi:hypothetical protein
VTAGGDGLAGEIVRLSQELRVPGVPFKRTLGSAEARSLAETWNTPLWRVEDTALEHEVAPMRLLRSLGSHGTAGVRSLLLGRVALVGVGAPIEMASERLRAAGLGRVERWRPVDPAQIEQAAGDDARPLSLRTGRPADAFAGVDAVGGFLLDAADEQLLQVMAHRAGAPVVLAGAQDGRAQATTAMPRDPGIALVYRGTHPHLDGSRRRAEYQDRAGWMAGCWLTDQLIALLTGGAALLRDRLLYADLDSEEMGEYPLR